MQTLLPISQRMHNDKLMHKREEAHVAPEQHAIQLWLERASTVADNFQPRYLSDLDLHVSIALQIHTVWNVVSRPFITSIGCLRP